MKSFRALLAGLGLAFSAATAMAGSLVVTPVNTVVFATQTFFVSIEGVDFAESIVGGGFNLGFDPAVLRLDSVTIAPIWEFAPSGGSVNNVAGTLTDASFNSFSNPRTGNFAVATLGFTAIGEGTSVLALLPSAVFVFADTAANIVLPTFFNGSVTAVPEPGSAALMLGGGALLVAALRRRVSAP